MARVTPEEDLDRMLERIEMSKISVQDRDTFDLAFEDATTLTTEDLSTNQRSFRNTVFDTFRQRHPEVRPDRLFKKAGGKDLKADRRGTAQRVVKTDIQFIKKGAKRVDFAGFDIREQDINRQKIRARKELKIPAFVKQKQVFAEKVFVIVKGKKQVRFRDRLGRFAKPSTKK